MNKAVFLDRDGVINHDPGNYTFEVDKFIILPGVFEFIKRMNQKGFDIIIITNQGGVAKGLYSLEDVHSLHAHFLTLCKNEDITIKDIFISPHHDMICKSLDRKPQGLMIEKAIYLHNIDQHKSYMIGDKDSDVETGESCGIKSIKIERNSSLLSIIDLLD